MINIAKLLKDAPKGMKLYSPLLGEVEFAEVMDTDYVPIRVMCGIIGERFDKYGRYKGNEYPDAECLLFPSKEVRTWEGWKPPVEPKFKVGDWIVRGEGFVYEPSLITEIRDYYICELLNGERVTYTLNDVHKNFHLWTIEDAQDGDVLYSLDSKQPFIYKERPQFSQAIGYCCINKFGEFGVWNTSKCVICTDKYIPATKEQRDLLFAKMKEAGYEWDEKKKELCKIQHYDISNFHAGMPVLVRDYDNSRWSYAQFSHYVGEECGFKFNACGIPYIQCIPFDGNEHLLGTTGPCDERFINW